MRVLGIETSCDETGVAIYDDAPGAGLLAHRLHSQIETMAAWCPSWPRATIFAASCP